MYAPLSLSEAEFRKPEIRIDIPWRKYKIIRQAHHGTSALSVPYKFCFRYPSHSNPTGYSC